MQRVHDTAELTPEGGWLVRRARFVAWRLDPELEGYAAWGNPTLGDAIEFVEVREALIARSSARAAAIVDFSALDGIEPLVFAHLVDHLRRKEAALSQVRRATAVIRPDGLAGSIVVGAATIAPHLFDMRTFTDYSGALAWLGRPEVDLSPVHAEIARGASAPALLTRLHDALRQARFDAHLVGAAETLGLAPRTLQAQLAAVGTSFRDELNRAKRDRAEALLRDPSLKIAAIAFEVGCSSPAHFSTWFKRVTGRSPSAFRASLSGG